MGTVIVIFIANFSFWRNIDLQIFGFLPIQCIVFAYLLNIKFISFVVDSQASSDSFLGGQPEFRKYAVVFKWNVDLSTVIEGSCCPCECSTPDKRFFQGGFVTLGLFVATFVNLDFLGAMRTLQ